MNKMDRTPKENNRASLPMTNPHPTIRLKHDLRRLFRSMDFVSRHAALKRGGREAAQLAEIYQQLGSVWEFLALQCPHREGWRKTRDGQRACRVCGSIKGAPEQWLLLRREGKKTIGRRAVPTSKRVFATRKQATVINDTVMFHGAKLNVEVLNPHRPRLFRSPNITIAADRLVSLAEGGVECRFDSHLLTLRMARRKRGEAPLFSAFVSELPRKALKRFPVMLEYGRRGEFIGLTIFKSQPFRRRASFR
jgi:hypothetical protein